MYLSKLEVVGFKSFAQKISLTFSEGITAIVGPNGCGKTNIVDAIRWVLGEQRAGVLRSEIMENVIFNGTSSRRPLGMAEVSLIIENNRNVLPIEYSEVTVTRRLFRNGDSNYLMNNTSCRLRDIIDLFMDTGMGADSYSVIELKMVEAILSGKPEERRHLFEEAAGVNKYKVRRKEATRKLAAVQGDMTRIRDILSEVQKNVNSLSRQAAKTQRYNKLMEQLRTIESSQLRHEYNHFRTELSAIQPILSQLVLSRNSEEADIERSEAELLELKSKIAILNEEFRVATEREAETNDKLSKTKTELAVTRERIVSATQNRDRLAAEIASSGDYIKKLQRSREQNASGLEEMKARKATADETFAQLKDERDSAYSQLAELRATANESNETLLNLQNRISTLKSTLNRNQLRKSSLETRLENGEGEIEEINAKIDAINQEAIHLEDRREQLAEAILTAENNQSAAQEKKSNLQGIIDSLQIEIGDTKNNISSQKTKLEFLSGLVDSPDESSKFLMKSTDWQTASERVLLEEIVGADEEYRIAVESALGSLARCFVVDTAEEAFSAIQILESSYKGKATFICRDKVPDIPAPAPVKAEDGIFGRLSEIVRTDDCIRNAVRAEAGDMLLVRGLAEARKAVDGGLASAAVTLKGELVRQSGSVRGGSVLKTEGIYVGKIERMKEINSILEKANSDLARLEEQYSCAKSEIASIDLRLFAEALRNAENAKNANEQKISQLKYQIEALAKNSELVSQNMARVSEEMLEIQQEEAGTSEELSEHESAMEVAREEHKSRIAELNQNETNYEEKKNKAHEAELDAIKLGVAISTSEAEIERMARQIKAADERALAMENDRFTNSAISDKLGGQEIQLQSELDKLTIDFNSALAECDRLKSQLAALQEQSEQYSADITMRRKQHERTLDEMHSKEIKISELKLHIEAVAQKAMEAYSISFDAEEFVPEEGFSLEEAKKEILSLKEKLGNLGSVNFMALEEYQEQHERLVFYERQIKDLVESEKNLQETITEINMTAEDMFRSTFDQVQKNFKELFLTLFGDDAEAELRLADDNVLETDIEIIAKPPSKRPHSIEMLSGGEKTLTAIALLFSIYLVKPSPFCILDEVDAPLDDANIDKFINLIRSFSNRTQFLIVTHNKRTMEAADNLYGITQQEEGVSQVVSVRMSKN